MDGLVWIHGAFGVGKSSVAAELEPATAARSSAALGITIREWQADDREAVQSLLRLLSLRAKVTTQDTPTWVAERGGRVVGMVTLCVFKTLTGPKAYLDHLVVAPSCRRQGIGRALVRHAIEHARIAGASRIDLTAGDEKEAGRALYESLGFHKRDTSTFRLTI